MWRDWGRGREGEEVGGRRGGGKARRLGGRGGKGKEAGGEGEGKARRLGGEGEGKVRGRNFDGCYCMAVLGGRG